MKAYKVTDKQCACGYSTIIFAETREKARAIAWIRIYKGKPLPAGATIDEAIEWLKKCGAKWGELHE